MYPREEGRVRGGEAMAATACGRRALLRSLSSSPKSLFRSLPSPSTSCSGRTSTRGLHLSRLPVELGCAQSLMPLHSATAAALLNSKLSSKPGSWGWLSEGFATPL